MNHIQQSAYIPKWARYFTAIVFIAAMFMRNDILLRASTYSPHDAGLFFRTVKYLLGGKWLGPYDNLTLAKGPLLSFLAAGANVLGIPYKPMEFMIYLLICLVVVVLVFRLSQSAVLMVALFFFLAFNSSSWSVFGLVFMREPLYLLTSLAVFGLTFWSLWLAGDFRQRLLFGVGSGVAFGLFWLTR